MGSRNSNSSIHEVHRGGEQRDEISLPLYDPSLSRSIIQGLEATQKYVLNHVERRMIELETNLGRELHAVAEAVCQVMPQSPPQDELAARG